MQVWTYAIATDVSGAPNFEGFAATLAICKPPIRRKAVIGDLMLAFNGKEAERGAGTDWDPNSVRWAGVVGETLSFAEYWSDPRFAGKRPGTARMPDNIYEPVGGALVQAPNHVHDARHVANDVRGENALIFAPSWYFRRHRAHAPRSFRTMDAPASADRTAFNDLKRGGGERSHRMARCSAAGGAAPGRGADRLLPS